MIEALLFPEEILLVIFAILGLILLFLQSLLLFWHNVVHSNFLSKFSNIQCRIDLSSITFFFFSAVILLSSYCILFVTVLVAFPHLQSSQTSSRLWFVLLLFCFSCFFSFDVSLLHALPLQIMSASQHPYSFLFTFFFVLHLTNNFQTLDELF